MGWLCLPFVSRGRDESPGVDVPGEKSSLLDAGRVSHIVLSPRLEQLRRVRLDPPPRGAPVAGGNDGGGCRDIGPSAASIIAIAAAASDSAVTAGVAAAAAAAMVAAEGLAASWLW